MINTLLSIREKRVRTKVMLLMNLSQQILLIASFLSTDFLAYQNNEGRVYFFLITR